VGYLKSPESDAKKIFGKRASFYAASGCHRDPEVLARVVKLSSPEPGFSALDIATGTGHTALALAPHVGFLVGIDVTPEMLGEARRAIPDPLNARIEFALADTHRLPFRDLSFHLLTCRRAAHHFTDILGAMREWKRVVRPGGRIVVDDRSVPDDDVIDECMNELDRYHDPSHVRQYRRGEWRDMLETVGFRIESIELYTKHRPLSSLTDHVPRERVTRIVQMIEDLDAAQREAMQMMEIDGEVHFNHWYIMISASVSSD
jgi:ubiquinone/menaquinone biosynthesis C-methylase UbiE